ncbi:MAG: rRNA pseudouridine synthase [Oscillospiraceae bacterium]|nr:rRNA pseudouridine synthase [Oscillospiraceae bacterium]
MSDNKLRLQKFLAERGVASRRGAEELILAGRVTVNGHPAVLGNSVDPRQDLVAVDGVRVEARRDKPVYLMLHKPRGVLTTMRDERGRRCVAQLVSERPERLFPVGRLDRESEGLLLMTNDGDFANAILHPSRHVPKIYRVTIPSGVAPTQTAALAAGVELDGERTAPALVRELIVEPDRTVLEITLREGRNRQIRRMCEAVGLSVARLKRIAIGPVKLGTLPPGKWRELTAEEVRRLWK